MINPSRYAANQHLHLAGLALVLSLGGCWEVDPESDDVGKEEVSDTVVGQGGKPAFTDLSANQGGATLASGGISQSSASSQTSANVQSGGAPGSGGNAQTRHTGDSTLSDSSVPSGSSAQSGGSPASGGDASSSGGTQSTEVVSSPASGGTAAISAFSSPPTGGTRSAGGATSVSSAAQAGTSGSSEVLESICVDEEGGAIPYDYSMGVVSEYSFELSMNCDLGGFLMPLILADPEGLSEVNAFALEATDWYRAEILKCASTTSLIGPDGYGLLPTSQSDAISADDVEASIALFLMVIDRHDTQPDAVSATKKEKIKNRLKTAKTRAVHNSAVGLTKTLTEPDCVPALPTGG